MVDFRTSPAERPKRRQPSSRPELVIQDSRILHLRFFKCITSQMPVPAPVQKSSMLSEDDHALLHDTCCLWLWLLPKLKLEFPGTVIARHEELFAKGLLGYLQVSPFPTRLSVNAATFHQLAGAKWKARSLIGWPEPNRKPEV